MESVALFDVDGTVISRDSFLLIVKSTLARSPWRALLLVCFVPVFAATALFKLEKSVAKSCTLWCLTVFRGKRGSVRFFKTLSSEIFTGLWFAQMPEVLADLRDEGVGICYISASGQIWLRHLLTQSDAGAKTIIGTRLGFFAGGVIVRGKNCYGEEKIHRLGAHYKGSLPQLTAGYTDNPSDLPFLRICQKRFVINPKLQWIPKFQAALKGDFILRAWTSERDPVPR